MRLDRKKGGNENLCTRTRWISDERGRKFLSRGFIPVVYEAGRKKETRRFEITVNANNSKKLDKEELLTDTAAHTPCISKQ